MLELKTKFVINLTHINQKVINLNYFHSNTRDEEIIDDDIYYFLKYIINKTNVDIDAFMEILKGAFIIVKDSGEFYRHFIKNGNLIERDSKYFESVIHKSSHWSKDAQYRLGKKTLLSMDKK
jgi:hypothetical protein